MFNRVDLSISLITNQGTLGWRRLEHTSTKMILLMLERNYRFFNNHGDDGNITIVHVISIGVDDDNDPALDNIPGPTSTEYSQLQSSIITDTILDMFLSNKLIIT